MVENKKYQVFISSTFKDLEEERKKVIELLLKADCIPVGMEAFVAKDDEQFNVIKSVIDLCDFYILIIGGCYGTINAKTQLSYTEMEYDYAKSQNIPVLVFCLNDSVNLPSQKIDNDETKAKQLAEFKRKVISNRLATVWKDIGDLLGNVAISITNAKKDFKRPGYTRGGMYDEKTLLEQINSLRLENNKLVAEKEKLKKDIKFVEYDTLRNTFYRLGFVSIDPKKILALNQKDFWLQTILNIKNLINELNIARVDKYMCNAFVNILTAYNRIDEAYLYLIEYAKQSQYLMETDIRFFAENYKNSMKEVIDVLKIKYDEMPDSTSKDLAKLGLDFLNERELALKK